MKKVPIKLLSICIAVLLMIPTVSIISPFVSAVSYKGSGTKKDPYLVETAEQLDGMRDNLSAVYKLNANISLAGVKSADPTPRGNFGGGFVPIGYIAKPFTGTFTCDTDASGNPKFTISNLTVTNNAGTIYGHKLNDSKSYSDYVKDNSHWEAALFGATDGATVSNISITNAKIVNTVVGQNQMNGDYSINPGQGTGELQAAILIAKSNSTTVSNCSVQGNVSGASFMGGLIGSAKSTKISDCTVKVNINSTALWCTGGVVGSSDKNTITRTSFEGNIVADSCQAGPSLFGEVGNCTVSDCYAWGTISKGDTFSYSLSKAKKVTNCYSAGKMTNGSTKSGTSKVATNSYIVSGGYSESLPEISKEELKQKFTGLAAWDVSGDLPVLKKTAAASTPGSAATNESGTAGTSGNAEQGTTAEAGEIGGTSAVLYNGIDVMAELEELPDAYDIESKDYKKYIELYNAYMSMPEEKKEEIDEETDTAIKEIGEVVSKNIADEIHTKLNKLPEPEKITDKNKKALSEIVELYKLIPSKFKDFVESGDLEKLRACMTAINMDTSAIPAVSSGDSSGIKIITVTLIAVNILLILGTATLVTFMVIDLVKRKRSKTEDDLDELSEARDE